MRRRISHDRVVIGKDRVHRKGPGIVGIDTKNVNQWYRRFITFRHAVGGLLFQTVNGTNARHDAVKDIHEHGAGEKEGPKGKNRHDADQLRQNDIVHAGIAGAKEVIVPKKGQRQDGTDPRIYQKQ